MTEHCPGCAQPLGCSDGVRYMLEGPEECGTCDGAGCVSTEEIPAAMGAGGVRGAVFPGAWSPGLSRGAPWISELDEPGSLVGCPDGCRGGELCHLCDGTGRIFVAWANGVPE